MTQREATRRKHTGSPGNGGKFDYDRTEPSRLELSVSESDPVADRLVAQVQEIAVEYDNFTIRHAEEDVLLVNLPEHIKKMRDHQEQLCVEAGQVVAELAEHLQPKHPRGDTNVAELNRAMSASEQVFRDLEVRYDELMEQISDHPLSPRTLDLLHAYNADHKAAQVGDGDAARLGHVGYRHYLDHMEALCAESGSDYAKTRLVSLERKKNELSILENEDIAEGYRTALSRVRLTGGELLVDERSNKQAVHHFVEAAEVFPSEWLDYSNDGVAPITKTTKGRAHYAHAKVHEFKSLRTDTRFVYSEESEARRREGPGESWELDEDTFPLNEHTRPYEVTRYKYRRASEGETEPPKGRDWSRYVDENTGATYWRQPIRRMVVTSSKEAPEMLTSEPKKGRPLATAIHELAHRMEHTVPEIAELEQSFWRRRVRGDVFRMAGYGPNEEFKEGDFATPYIGKRYPMHVAYEGAERRQVNHKSSEVVSVGMEALFAGHYGGLVGRGKYPADPDHRNFVLGVLALAGRRELNESAAVRSLRKRANLV